MRISKIAVTLSKTKQVAAYEPIRVEGHATIELDESENTELHYEMAREMAIAEAKQQMMDAFKNIMTKK